MTGMKEDRMVLVDKLEEIDKLLRALYTGVALMGVGLEGFGDKAVAYDMVTLVRNTIGDIRAELDDVTGAVMALERMSA